MARKADFLRTPFNAYSRREVPEENTELTHVGPGTPCGEYFRRYWLPVGRSEDLEDLPHRIRILGEDLVLFRDQGGRVGLLQLHCSHRGASLEFGRISERGITCCYHGWNFDVDGTILATPGETADSTLKDRLFHGAYPTHEFGGLVFAYMGPPDKKPPPPMLDTFDLPGYRLLAGPMNYLPCNWLQVKDNSMDPVHTVYLHTVVTGTQFTESYAEVGTLDWMETPIGMVYIHTRRIGDNIWVHLNDFIPPSIHQFAPTWEDGETEKTFQRPMMTNWAVPVDDTNTIIIGFRHANERMSEDEHRRYIAQRGTMQGETLGQTADRPYEERQRVPGDYDAQVGQRPIAVHALEHLASTDRGVSMMRRMVRDGIRAVRDGKDPANFNRVEGRVLLTYSNDTVLRIPKKPTTEENNGLLLETGRKVTEDLIENHPAAAKADVP